MGNSSILLEAVSPKLQYVGLALANPHSFSIERGHTYAVVGANGAGKTTLGHIIEKGWNIATNVIRGDKKSLTIKNVEFTDIHSLAGFKGEYYQQRFESTMNDDIPTVAQLMQGKISDELWTDLCSKLAITDIAHKRINYLSSGELRKFLIINILTYRPDILIIDNPYIGLDADSRSLFNELLQGIAAQGTAIVMLLCNVNEIPQFAHHVIPMHNLTIGKTIDYQECDKAELAKQLSESLFTHSGSAELMPLSPTPPEVDFDVAFALTDADVRYEQTVIINNVNWTVHAGEKWALLGENGSGKSTLLSLVNADNPQGYRNDITLFDRRRGTGESIWDIKRRIAYISPEMHLYFNGIASAREVIASGFHDNVGLYRRPRAEQLAITDQWMNALGIAHLADRRFSTLSSGEQRLVLIVRTLVKQAPVLILDEPLHGLDQSAKALVAQCIERITAQHGITLVYVTHYAHEIPSLVDHTFRLSRNHR